MKQEERRKKTIQLLLDSTKVLIETKGCHSITMNDIMKQSKLSKGAIFHYVNSKDEIFAWVLQEQLDQTNEKFFNEVNHGEKTFEGPLDKILQSLSSHENQTVTNRVLLYLLGRENEPSVAKVLEQYYEQVFHYTKQWIASGQKHGVIKNFTNASRVAELLILLTFGYRVRQSIPIENSSFTLDELRSFMSDLLKA
ncbi:transcriptional regulator, TetR family [Seinonella peptonophila]|uniref:Transcriptional regulator, TetR family n=1 Tax=Seinonella peptonophila TaxID=112248 RepID=A0A1M4ZBA3_9BACL|nr:TetR/AcrR family transcriptional regulator [Seinonella peptonophila]SHF15052.1 transcriptional regulator, TetR family [Seinonella peptonophila]